MLPVQDEIVARERRRRFTTPSCEIMARYELVDLNPITSLANSDVINFIDHGTAAYSICPSDTRLILKLQIVDENNKLVTTPVDVFPVPLLPHALFNKIELRVGGVTVGNTSETYGVLAFLTTHLSLSKGTYDIVAEDLQLGQIDEGNITSFSPNDDKGDSNDALTSRLFPFIDGGGTVTTISRPLSDLIASYHGPLPNNLSFELKMTRSSPEFYFVGPSLPSTAGYKIRIADARLRIARMYHHGGSESGCSNSGPVGLPATINFTRLEMTSFIIPNGVSGHSATLHWNRLPTRYFVF